MKSHPLALARSFLFLFLCAGLVACQSGRPATRAGEVGLAPGKSSGEGAAQIQRIAAATAEAGDASGAADLYARAAEVAPDDAAIQVRLGNSLMAMRDYAGARRSFERAMALAPGNLDALRGRGLVALGEDRPDLAIGSLEAALGVDAHDRRALNGLGVALDATGRHDEAQTRYRQILMDDPQNVAARNNLGLSLALSGKRGEAVEMIGAIASSPATTPRIRQNYALVLGIAGRVEEADRVAKQDLGRASAENNHHVFLSLAEGTGASPPGPDVPERPLAVPLKPVASTALPDTTPEGPVPRVIRQPPATPATKLCDKHSGCASDKR
jgi:Flp pilus assembly protein TadD